MLAIDTAGSGKEEIILGGIPKDTAISLRQRILSRPAGVEDSDQTPKPDSSQDNVLLSRNNKDIAIYGLTINFILWIFIALGAAFGSYDFSEDAMLWLASKVQLEEVLTFVQADGSFIKSGLMIFGLILAILILLPLVSVLGALFRHYGYELRLEGETYRKTSGFLSRHDESLKRHKIQAAILLQNFVAQLFNRTNLQLRVASAGSGIEQGQLPTGSQNIFLVPALHAFEVQKLTPEFLPDCSVSDVVFSRVNLRRLATVVLGLIVLPVTLVIGGALSVLFQLEIHRHSSIGIADRVAGNVPLLEANRLCGGR